MNESNIGPLFALFASSRACVCSLVTSYLTPIGMDHESRCNGSGACLE